jgi:uncharacterized membrane protein YdbT with pleckstrin-like domain
MPEIITEKTYPIQLLWAAQNLVILIVFVLVFIGVISGLSSILEGKDVIISFFYPMWFIFFGIVTYIPVYLTIKNFHFSLDKEFITINQGVLSKKQRQLPYGVIQDIVVGQSFVERLFGIANLTFENASQTGSGPAKVFGMTIGNNRRRSLYQEIGIQKDGKINIPGLKKTDAEALKNALLAKIKENPIKEQGL